MLKLYSVHAAFFFIIIEKFFRRKELLKFCKKLISFEKECKLLRINLSDYWRSIRKIFGIKFILMIIISWSIEIIMISSIGLRQQW